jgi:type III secretory pathway lipoprotein EscJ
MKKLIVIIIILIFKTACSQKNIDNLESDKKNETFSLLRLK